MGKTMDALLRRNFKTAKFKALVNLAISRLAVLKNQRQVRCVHARSDTVQLLNLGHQDALFFAEVVIKEQNMLDVFVMIEGYCHILIERAILIENNRESPDELKEAISSLIFAASRCGEFPELQEIRSMIVSRYGKEVAARAVELRSNCGVNQKMIQKLSTRHPSREIRMQVLQEIASEIGIVLHIEEEASVTTTKQNQPQTYATENKDNTKTGDQTAHLIEQFGEIQPDEQTSGPLRTRQQYSDVATAAQAAFESAAYAAAAARAAVELSRSESLDFHRNNQSSPTSRQRNRFDWDRSPRSSVAEPGENKHSADAKNSVSESEDEEKQLKNGRFHPQDSKGRASKKNLQSSPSDSSSDSDGNSTKEAIISSRLIGDKKPLEKVIFDQSDNENESNYDKIPWSSSNESGFRADKKSEFTVKEPPQNEQKNTWSSSNESGFGVVKRSESTINELPQNEQKKTSMDTAEVQCKLLNIERRRPISVGPEEKDDRHDNLLYKF